MPKKFILKTISLQSGTVKINLDHMYADNLTCTENSNESVDRDRNISSYRTNGGSPGYLQGCNAKGYI